jgi:hypothetical protein
MSNYGHFHNAKQSAGAELLIAAKRLNSGGCRFRENEESSMTNRPTTWTWCLILLWVVTAPGADQPSSVAADKQALSPLQDYIGGWKGVGQPRRGSNKDAWIEQSDWAWKFTESGASLVFDAPQGKVHRSGELRPGDKPNTFEFVATLPDGRTEERYVGSMVDGRLVLEAVEPSAGRPAQIALRQVADGKRLVITYSQRAGSSSNLSFLAEVGYTRIGSNFGKGTSGPECVVTGGYGSMAVQHNGETYYVCCTGCRDLFNDDPESVLADYRQRKQAEREKKGNQ